MIFHPKGRFRRRNPDFLYEKSNKTVADERKKARPRAFPRDGGGEPF
jgi:hypothetical protein